MLARIACASEPRASSTSSPLARSVATARNGIGSRSNDALPGDARRPVLQQDQEPVALDEAAGDLELPVAVTGLESERIVVFVLAQACDSDERALRSYAMFVKSTFDSRRYQVVGRQATCIEAAHDRPPCSYPRCSRPGSGCARGRAARPGARIRARRRRRVPCTRAAGRTAATGPRPQGAPRTPAASRQRQVPRSHAGMSAGTSGAGSSSGTVSQVRRKCAVIR
jgi:hypothetical protein